MLGRKITDKRFLQSLNEVVLCPEDNGNHKVFIVFDYVEYDLGKYMYESNKDGIAIHQTMAKVRQSTILAIVHWIQPTNISPTLCSI